MASLRDMATRGVTAATAVANKAAAEMKSSVERAASASASAYVFGLSQIQALFTAPL
jgi:hypothetical protein